MSGDIVSSMFPITAMEQEDTPREERSLLGRDIENRGETLGLRELAPVGLKRSLKFHRTGDVSLPGKKEPTQRFEGEGKKMYQKAYLTEEKNIIYHRHFDHPYKLEHNEEADPTSKGRKKEEKRNTGALGWLSRLGI